MEYAASYVETTYSRRLTEKRFHFTEVHCVRSIGRYDVTVEKLLAKSNLDSCGQSHATI